MNRNGTAQLDALSNEASLGYESDAVGIYVHIPYCVAKCPYCDFNSVAAASWPEDRYVEALKRELRYYREWPVFQSARVATIFFGGGTPSLFAAHSLGSILSEIAKLWPIEPQAEVTIEANPGTVDLTKLQAFRAAGINRISFGVQSFDESNLKLLGRIHSGEDAVVSVEAAFSAGFDNVNVDLIYALPGQTVNSWHRDLVRACALVPTHISPYNLTYEEGTPFYAWRRQGRFVPVDDETEIAMFQLAEEVLGAHGYYRYEISNYAKPLFICRHNLGYWSSRPYVGVGAGAHGYSPRGGKHHWGVRWANEKSPTRYMESVQSRGHARQMLEDISEQQAAAEFVFLALRCVEGVDARAFQGRFGTRLEEKFPCITDLAAKGLLEQTTLGWRLTPRGTMLADSVFAEFF
ncbi:MAG: coproporphyrinogen III oxidase [Candidatus Binatia bacterium]|nr:MAG: coproporphyrinogen III oxidase [Candidatus Binatia bacterium]